MPETRFCHVETGGGRRQHPAHAMAQKRLIRSVRGSEEIEWQVTKGPTA